MHTIFPEVGLQELEKFQTACDLQGHSRSLVLVQFERPHTISN